MGQIQRMKHREVVDVCPLPSLRGDTGMVWAAGHESGAHVLGKLYVFKVQDFLAAAIILHRDSLGMTECLWSRRKHALER